jgi:hypothetical protein
MVSQGGSRRARWCFPGGRRPRQSDSTNASSARARPTANCSAGVAAMRHLLVVGTDGWDGWWSARSRTASIAGVSTRSGPTPPRALRGVSRPSTSRRRSPLNGARLAPRGFAGRGHDRLAGARAAAGTAVTAAAVGASRAQFSLGERDGALERPPALRAPRPTAPSSTRRTTRETPSAGGPRRAASLNGHGRSTSRRRGRFIPERTRSASARRNLELVHTVATGPFAHGALAAARGCGTVGWFTMRDMLGSRSGTEDRCELFRLGTALVTPLRRRAR